MEHLPLCVSLASSAENTSNQLENRIYLSSTLVATSSFLVDFLCMFSNQNKSVEFEMTYTRNLFAIHHCMEKSIFINPFSSPRPCYFLPWSTAKCQFVIFYFHELTSFWPGSFIKLENVSKHINLKSEIVKRRRSGSWKKRICKKSDPNLDYSDLWPPLSLPDLRHDNILNFFIESIMDKRSLEVTFILLTDYLKN